jgi:dienelactone hydrolase
MPGDLGIRAKRSTRAVTTPYDRLVILAPVRTDVAFWHGMDRLAGEVVLPPWPGPHPTVVSVGPPPVAGRPCSWQQRLAAAGIGSFAYDPAGTGRSTGDWRRQTVGDRASEILAAREVLAAHPHVEPGAIALIGAGDAGWAAVRAEGFAQTFTALVLLSVSMLAPMAVEQYDLGRRLERHGVGADEIGLAQALLRERFRRLADGDGAERVLEAEAACRTAPWYRLMPRLAAGDVPLLTRLVGIDPAAELTAVTCPVLALSGAADTTQPVQRSVEALLRALRAGGHTDHASVVIPDADHELRTPDADMAPGVYELVVTWLDRRLGRRDGADRSGSRDALRAGQATDAGPARAASPPGELHLPLTQVLPVVGRPTPWH